MGAPAGYQSLTPGATWGDGSIWTPTGTTSSPNGQPWQQAGTVAGVPVDAQGNSQGWMFAHAGVTGARSLGGGYSQGMIGQVGGGGAGGYGGMGSAGGSTSTPGVIPQMQSNYNQLLGINQQRYANMQGAYNAGQSRLSEGLPSIYQGYKDLSSNVMNTLGMGQVLGKDGNWGVAGPAAAAIGRQDVQQQGAITQQMTDRGLGNTSVGGNLQNQRNYNTQQSYGSLGSQLASTAAGYQSQIGLAGQSAQMQGMGMQTGLTQAALGPLSQEAHNTAGNLTGQTSTSYSNFPPQQQFGSAGGYGGGSGGGYRSAVDAANAASLTPGMAGLWHPGFGGGALGAAGPNVQGGAMGGGGGGGGGMPSVSRPFGESAPFTGGQQQGYGDFGGMDVQGSSPYGNAGSIQNMAGGSSFYADPQAVSGQSYQGMSPMADYFSPGSAESMNIPTVDLLGMMGIGGGMGE